MYLDIDSLLNRAGLLVDANPSHRPIKDPGELQGTQGMVSAENVPAALVNRPGYHTRDAEYALTLGSPCLVGSQRP